MTTTKTEQRTRTLTRSRPRFSAARARALLRGVLKNPTSPAKTVMFCQLCELTGGPFNPSEAALLLKVHEQLHHGGVSLHRPPLPPAT